MYGGDILLHEDDRYIRAEEFLAIMRGMWSETPFSFDGRFYQVKESQLLIKPATVPPPEIFTASRSPRGLEMVAKYADWWFLDYDKSATDLAGVEDSLRRAMDGMNKRAAKYGRKVRFAFNPFVAFGDSDEAALERAKKLLTPGRARRRRAQDDAAGGPGDEVGLHRHAAEGAGPVAQVHRHGDGAVPVEIRADGGRGSRHPRRDHRAAAPRDAARCGSGVTLDPSS